MGEADSQVFSKNNWMLRKILDALQHFRYIVPQLVKFVDRALERTDAAVTQR